MSQDRAGKIKLLLFDVDGVLTDGKIWVLPATRGVRQSTQKSGGSKLKRGGGGFASSDYLEAKGFNAHDGTAVSLARVGGIKTGLITKRISETVALRARDLRLDYVCQGIHDKFTAFRQILEKEGLKADQSAFVGDDIIDLPVMRRCGLAIAVPNGREEVKREAHYITGHAGGDGALRDAVEYILKAQGNWERVLEEYISERSPKKSGT